LPRKPAWSYYQPMLKGSFNRLLASIQTVKGIGPATAAKLRARQIETLEDALLFLPVRYQDRRRATLISDLIPGQEAMVAGRIVKLSQGRPGPRRILKMVVADQTGRLSATWFGLGRRTSRPFESGQDIILAGRVEDYQGRPSMLHPEIIPSLDDPDHAGRFVPIYRPLPGVSTKQFRRLVGAIIEQELDRLESPLPDKLSADHCLLDLAQAFKQVHFPQSEEDASLAGLPRQSLIFTELFLFQAGLALNRHSRRSQKALPLKNFDQTRRQAVASLPFELTPAQERVLDELARDLAQNRPMNRLLQGDVGSGKTVLAGVVLLATALSGRQAVMMAPTELLAEQNFHRLSALAAPFDLKVNLLCASLSRARKRACLEGLASGQEKLVVGTQALIQDKVNFADLGLVVIDEQHRFGVLQRAALTGKGPSPHLLAMTATPIPRSLALTLHGDLDISVLGQKPPGRQKVVTRLLPPSRIQRAWQAVVNAAAQGLQAYVVLPSIEPGQGGLTSAQERFAQLKDTLPGLSLGLVHGRLDRQKQMEVMGRFAAGQIDVLVATTVVEVGLDAPQAAVMVVENAERFGLAQIHQLRGRVGRGGSKAACLLISEAKGESLERLKRLEQTDDGFEIAEADLVFRGPGDFLGVSQTGWPDFRLADLLIDTKLLLKARQAAFELVEADPKLKAKEHQVLAEILNRRWLRRLRLSRAG